MAALGSGKVGATGWGVVLLATLLLVGSGGAGWTVHRELERWSANMDAQALDRAQGAFMGVLKRERERGLSEARLLADDARIRGTVLVPRFDPATVRDVLTDLRAASRSHLLAVLDRRGRVRAVSGHDHLEDVDLSATEAVQAAGAEAATDVWPFGERLFVISVAPIRAGDQLEALLLIGTEIPSAQLAEIESREGVRGALVMGERVIVRGREDAELDQALCALRPDGAGPIRFAHASGAWLGRAHGTGRSAASARVVWAVARQPAWARAPLLSLGAAAPVAAVGLMWLLVLLLVRRSGKQGGPT